MSHKYPLTITWSEEDDEYVVTCDAFPGLSALGETEEEALEEGKIARQMFIDACLEEGIPLPEPNVVHEYSGQWRVRTPKSLHRRAVYLAESEGVSLNQYTNYALSEKVAADENASKVHKKLEGLIDDVMARFVRQNRFREEAYSTEPIRYRVEHKIIQETKKEVFTGAVSDPEGWNN